MKFWTCKEIAHLLRVSTMTVYRWVQAGDLVSVRVGKSLRVESSALDTFLAERSTV